MSRPLNRFILFTNIVFTFDLCRPSVTLIFDLLTPKVDRFTSQPRRIIVTICSKFGLFVFITLSYARAR